QPGKKYSPLMRPFSKLCTSRNKQIQAEIKRSKQENYRSDGVATIDQSIRSLVSAKNKRDSCSSSKKGNRNPIFTRSELPSSLERIPRNNTYHIT
ncbi:Hypothetical predicted protein, partial [Paramuricea clavata]